VAGISADMRALLASDDPHAQEAAELFTYRGAPQTAAPAEIRIIPTDEEVTIARHVMAIVRGSAD
jgi:acetate kinase